MDIIEHGVCVCVCVRVCEISRQNLVSLSCICSPQVLRRALQTTYTCCCYVWFPVGKIKTKNVQLFSQSASMYA